MILQIILIILINNISFMLMFYFCLKLSKGEQIKTPIRYIKEKHKQKEAEKRIEEEKNYLDIMLENINNYDGTSKGQKDFK